MTGRPPRALAALVVCADPAADDALLEALDRGDPAERSAALAALLDRRTLRGLVGVVARHGSLPDALRRDVSSEVARFDAALRHAGRDPDPALRREALALIAIGRSAPLAPVAAESVAHLDPAVRAAAVAVLVELAGECADLVARLHAGRGTAAERSADYRRLTEARPPVEHAVASAVRDAAFAAVGGADRAALVEVARALADRPDSPVRAALLARGDGCGDPASVSGPDDGPSTPGVDGGGRLLGRLARVARLASGTPSPATRTESVGSTRSAEVADGSDPLLDLLGDADPRIARMAAREVLRTRPTGGTAALLRRLSSADPTVRATVSRGLAPGRFAAFWSEWDRLDPAARTSAGRTLLRALPDAAGALRRRLVAGSGDERAKAVGMAEDLGVAAGMADAVVGRCSDADERVRSRAVAVVGRLGRSRVGAEGDRAVRRLLDDADDRVRANAVEAAGLLAAGPSDAATAGRIDAALAAVLVERSRSAVGRERANAIRALGHLRVPAASDQLLAMLRDDRAEHRISAMWALRRAGWWRLLGEVGRLAQADPHARSRRYALALLRNVAEESRAARAS